MELESGVFVEPGPHALVLVSGVVVADQVYPKFVGDRLVDGAQELQELGMAMPGQECPMTLPASTLSAAKNVVVPFLL